MKEYKVRIMATVDTTEIVEAESIEEANRKAEEQWSDTFIVLNTYSKELENFTDIIGYEPVELPE